MNKADAGRSSAAIARARLARTARIILRARPAIQGCVETPAHTATAGEERVPHGSFIKSVDLDHVLIGLSNPGGGGRPGDVQAIILKRVPISEGSIKR